MSIYKNTLSNRQSDLYIKMNIMNHHFYHELSDEKGITGREKREKEKSINKQRNTEKYKFDLTIILFLSFYFLLGFFFHCLQINKTLSSEHLTQAIIFIVNMNDLLF